MFKMGNMASTAGEIASNVSKAGAAGFLSTYIIPNSKELAINARESLKRNLKYDIKEDVIQKAAQTSSHYNDSTFRRTVSSFSDAVKSNNSEEAKAIAGELKNKFDSNEFITLLNEEEEKISSKVDLIDSLTDDEIKSVSTAKIMNKIKKSQAGKFIENPIDIADKAYVASGFNPKTYFTANDAKTNKIRLATATGGYLGGSMIVRGLQGGNPIRNEYGERDIAGIPFI